MNLSQSSQRSLHRLGTIPLVCGIMAVVTALVAFVWPGSTVLTIITIIGFYLLLSGIGAFIAGRRLGTMPGLGTVNVTAIISALIGLVMVWHPSASANIFASFAGGGLLLVGVMMVSTSVALRRVTSSAQIKGSATRPRWVLIAGIVIGVLGLLFLAHPNFGTALLGILLGTAVLLVGIALLIAGMSLRRLGRTIASQNLFQDTSSDNTNPHDVIIDGEVIPDDNNPTGSQNPQIS